VSDIVYIKNLEINTIIGIHDWERQSRQIVSIDLEMATDIHEFGISWLRLRIGKPGAIANAADVGVIIERGGTP
jgi:dihydroneopterin aldolase